MSMQKFMEMNGKRCNCGKVHSFPVQKILCGKGVINELPQLITEGGYKKVFVLADSNTYQAAGQKLCALLQDAKIPYTSYVVKKEVIEPDEASVGSVMMHYDYDCDVIVGVGSGVINDISKILSAVTKNFYIIVGTAPSMDGYASATSSMTRDGLKISLPSKSANIIVGDTNILCNAPEKMLKAGLGDMLTKYVSICEWRLANLIVGEYYCEEIAGLVRSSLQKCIDNADGLLKRDPEAVEAVFEGLVICGAAMTYAGASRPASGVEHYFSHIWDMRGVEFKIPVELHGIQCVVGTLLAVKYYEQIKTITPDRDKALAYAANFSYEEWKVQLRTLLGKGAESMIALEEKEQKYSKENHKARLEIILNNWEEILKIIEEELPTYGKLDNILDCIDAPKTMAGIGVDETLLPLYFQATKDIRDKYVLSRLAWDLGIVEVL